MASSYNGTKINGAHSETSAGYLRLTMHVNTHSVVPMRDTMVTLLHNSVGWVGACHWRRAGPDCRLRMRASNMHGWQCVKTRRRLN